MRQRIHDSTTPAWVIAALVTLIVVLWEIALFHAATFGAGIFITPVGFKSYWTPKLVAVLIAAVATSVLLAFLFIWATVRSGRVTRICAFVAFSAILLYEYSYFVTLGRFSTGEDMLMALLYASDRDLIGDSIRGFISFTALPVIAVFALALACTRPRRRFHPAVVLGVVALNVAFYAVVLNIWFLAQSAFPTTAFGEFMRAATDVPLKMLRDEQRPRDRLAYRSDNVPQGNIVFVVDESVRSDHLSINGYERDTTPFLEALAARGLVHNWGESASGGTYSLSSNNLLLTGITDLPNTDHRLQRVPSIFQYAKAMGYTTYYLDDTINTFWNGTYDDLQFIDHWENATQFNTGPVYDADTRLARRLRTILEGSTGNFVWVNKRGVHFNYNHTFPPNQARWTPLLQGAAYDPEQHGALVNSYDNGLRYNLEGFFRTLLDGSPVLRTSVIMYTSDHGQTLAEHGETKPHNGPSRNEARVPILLLSETHDGIDTRFRASHSNIFATLLDLMGVPEGERQGRHPVSLLRATAADSVPRRYFVGPLDGSGEGFKPFDP